jgi:hypothetical protein
MLQQHTNQPIEQPALLPSLHPYIVAVLLAAVLAVLSVELFWWVFQGMAHPSESLPPDSFEPLRPRSDRETSA